MKSKALGVGSGAVLIPLMVFVFGMVRPLGASAKTGAQLKIVTKDGTIVQGELLAVKGHSLLVDGGNYATGAAIELDDIRDLVMVGKSRTLAGSGIGMLGGGLVGVIIGAGQPVQETGWLAMPGLHRAGNIALGAGIGAAAGAIVGALLWTLARQNEPLIVASVCKIEPGELLKKLRSVAKDPEYQ